MSLIARVLYTETGRIDWPVVRVEDGLIVSVEAGEPNGSSEALTAAFFDVHVHGAMSFDFMAAGAGEIDAVGRFLAGRGVGHYLPTTVTAPVEATLRALEVRAEVIEAGPAEGAAVPVGVHLEGPFVSHAKRGVHPVASLQPPSVALFERFQEAARGHIKLVTLAPELPGALELIEYATNRGVKVSLGHSDATAAEATAGIAAGATSATHTFNAMRALGHREPGILGVVLDREELYAELICDGVHVDPSMVRLWLKAKGPERAMLVTDGMSATGMPEGEYDLGGMAVTVKDGVCLFGTTLAGSVLTMDKAVENLRRFTGSSLGAAVRLAAQNPARMLGLAGLTGLEVGSPANFNVFDEAGQRVGGYLGGRRVG
jgi:N-acetylglucosamine-6-phosphate deacetylase